MLKILVKCCHKEGYNGGVDCDLLFLHICLCLLFFQMAISELLIGTIQAESHYPPLNFIAKKYGLSWETIWRAVHYTGRPLRMRRVVPKATQKRRKCVVQLAKKRVCKDGRNYPVFCSANAIKKGPAGKVGVCVQGHSLQRPSCQGACPA